MTLVELDKLLGSSKPVVELLGTDPASVLRSFYKISHPDHNPGQEILAKSVFERVVELEKHSKGRPAKLISANREYELGTRVAIGDVSDVCIW